MTDGEVLEVAIFNVKEGKSHDFVKTFKTAKKIITSAKGCVSHNLMKCSENSSQFLLLVNWETLDNHQIGFRQSDGYNEWKKLLHHFYDPFPTVEHYQHVP